MLSDSKSTDIAPLSPRAGIALLTLQLRAATQEAIDAEAEAAVVDLGAARDLLRARLEPMLDDRRRKLDATLTSTRTEATNAITAAHRAASVIVMHARPVTPAVEPPAIESPVEEPVVDVVGVEPEQPMAVEFEPDEALEPEPELELVPEPEPEPEPEPAPAALHVPALVPPAPPLLPPAPPLLPPAPHTVVASPVNVVIDAEAFARVFATVFAALLEERQSAPGWSAASQVYVPVIAPAKQSFWTHARHPDVLLMGVATVIVLVVLAAWMA